MQLVRAGGRLAIVDRAQDAPGPRVIFRIEEDLEWAAHFTGVFAASFVRNA
ncbi:hypothetical protein [Methylobacterium oxalidis]|uniref:hypothetical protein n=1 Tax=Methylobacterium oxalidis TaxID=944322 RepID=UPI0033147FA8